MNQISKPKFRSFRPSSHFRPGPASFSQEFLAELRLVPQVFPVHGNDVFYTVSGMTDDQLLTCIELSTKAIGNEFKSKTPSLQDINTWKKNRAEFQRELAKR